MSQIIPTANACSVAVPLLFPCTRRGFAVPVALFRTRISPVLVHLQIGYEDLHRSEQTCYWFLLTPVSRKVESVSVRSTSESRFQFFFQLAASALRPTRAESGFQFSMNQTSGEHLSAESGTFPFCSLPVTDWER